MAVALGIDLGTTNTVVAAADLATGVISDVPIPQLVAPGEVAPRDQLPSTLYIPAPGELDDDQRRLPWGQAPANPAGHLARDMGARVPGRVVVSAKSWLSVAGVDRKSRFLPWATDDDTLPRLSPVEVQTNLLQHIHDAVSAADLGEIDDVTITVPASFDEISRELTLEAAGAAGFPKARLLEEPQAAFYALLHREQKGLKKFLHGVRLILVVDVGGGTTDLSLLAVDAGSGKGPPKIERIAVGEHLMLGGDNMDVTLARLVEQKLTGAVSTLDAVSFAQLVLSARLAKETLLGQNAPEEYGITLLSRGKKLLGGARTSVAGRDETVAMLLDGFLPLTGPADVVEKQRAGLAELGLPYARDPALSRHLATFLRRHKDAAANAGARIADGLPLPDAVLLNGGVFRAPAIRNRLDALLRQWSGDDAVRFLDGGDDATLDRAVARGAAYAGLVRRGQGVRIGSGSARSYFVGVGADDVGGPAQALCVVPRGMHEGEQLSVDRTFRVVVGQPVSFPLYSATFGADQAGDIVDVADLEALPALSTVLAPGREVPVRLEASLSEVGTLELALRMTEEALERFRLSFSTRLDAVVDGATTKGPGEIPSGGPVHKRIDDGKALILGYFGNKSKDVDAKRVKDLRRDLEKIFGPRDQWTVGLLRELGGVLLSGASRRRRSADHERSFFQNLSFMLRPGVGAAFDDWRVEQLWPLWSEGIQYVTEKATWSSWFVLWRRVAAGLDAGRQAEIWAYLKPWLLEQGTGGKGVGSTPHGQDEMVRLACSLERVSSSEKTLLGAFVLKKFSKGNLASAWPLGRLGARQPLVGAAQDVVSAVDASAWCERLLELDLNGTDGAPFALAQIARLTGDRARDLDGALRERISARLAKAKAPEAWQKMVLEVVPLSADDEAAAFGEALPVGLRL